MMRRTVLGLLVSCMQALLLVGVGLPVPANAEPFSFAVLADPHIDGNPQHTACLEAAVRWIITNSRFNNVELVFIAGDIGWGYSGGHSNLETAREVLDALNETGIPYVPIIGDNEVHAGAEAEFDAVFAEQYQYLSEVVEHWRQAPTPVGGMYLQNFSFDYKGCHFVCADFAPRTPGRECGELHDFPGGSWPWFTDDIANCPKPKQESIIVLTHIGMFRTGVPEADQYLYSESDLSTITDFLSPYRDYVAANYAGHIHENWYWVVPSSGDPIYYAYVTDETWYDARWPESQDTAITVRWVRVNDSSPTVQYAQHIENAPVAPQSVPTANCAVLLLLLSASAVFVGLRPVRN